MYPITRLIIVIFIFKHVSALTSEIIKQYYQFEYVSFINLIHCFDKRDEIDFLKNFTTDFTVKSFNMNERKVLNQSELYVARNMKVGMWMDTRDCPYQDFLNQLSDMQAFKGIHYFLVFLKDENFIEPTFENVILTINTNLKVMVNDYSVYDVYNPSTLHGGKLIYNPYKNWNSETRTFERFIKHEHLYWARRNMTGIIFHTMVVLPKPFPGTLEEYLFNDDDREINSFNRFHAVLMYHVEDYYDYRLNMTYTLSWGYKQPNGSFDGMVRALELRQIDFGSSPLFVKDERMPALDYGRRTWKLKSAFLFRTPKRPASFEVFLRPLDGQVWYLTALACIIIVILLKLSLKAEIAKFKHLVETFEPSWSHIALFTLGALCQQGCATSPTGTSSRISFIFIFIFTVLLYQYYSASIVSILIMTPARFIRNIRDLAYSTLILGCEDILYNRDYINKLANDTVVNRLSKKSPKGNDASFYIDPEVGLPRVAAGGYAYHVELATAYPIIAKTFDEDAICSLDEITLFQVQQMHQPLQKGSEFREMLDYVLHRIDEGGLMYRQLKHWHAKKPECIRSRPATSSVSIEEFYPALSMLLLGMMVSVIIFIIEHILHVHQRRREEEEMVKELRVDKRNHTITRVRKL